MADVWVTETRDTHLAWGYTRGRVGWWWYVDEWKPSRPEGWPVAEGWRPTRAWAERAARAHSARKPSMRFADQRPLHRRSRDAQWAWRVSDGRDPTP